MTEREYVETILERATAYIEWVGQDDLAANDGEQVMRLWETTKEKLSAHTMRDLCMVWLGAERPGD
jgi:hypothetical protein